MPTPEMNPLFVYGTLRDREILAAVLGRTVDTAVLRPAQAPGWRAVYYPGESYPALVVAERDAAPGLLIDRLTVTDFERLDLYEGNQYRRCVISTLCGAETVMADAYLPLIAIAPDAPAWNLDEWKETRIQNAAETGGFANV